MLDLARFRLMLAVLGTLAAAAHPARADELVGRWYDPSSYQKPMDMTLEEIAVYREDGSWEIDFFRREGCTVVYRSHEEGFWQRVDPDLLQVIITRINGQVMFPVLQQTYRILELHGDRFRYESLKVGTVFTARRVDVTLAFPDCGPIS